MTQALGERDSRSLANVASAPKVTEMATLRGPALQRLRQETAGLHQEAERHVRILDAGADRVTYGRFLARMYGFHAAVEDVFAAHPGLAGAGFDAAGRRKRGLLARDLAALGVDAADLPRCAALPALDGLPEAVGAAYVIEGSTLGGAFVRAHLPEALAPLAGIATSFLDGYGPDTGARWRGFVALAEEALPGDDERALAAAAARETFAALIAWLDEPAAEPPHPFRGLDRRVAREVDA